VIKPWRLASPGSSWHCACAFCAISRGSAMFVFLPLVKSKIQPVD
jgi:hypothetical protein